MNDVTIIDQFLNTFATYIDSGFGLLQGEVAFLTATLIVIDMTIAGLYWAMSHATGQGEDVIAKLLRKVLYVGAFAYILGNFNWLASIVFRSFAGLGLTASALTFTTVLALVPFFAVALSVFTAFPAFAQLQQVLQQWLIDSLIPASIADSVMRYLTQFAGQASELGLAGFAEEAVKAIRESFNATGHPRDLTLYHATGVGNGKDRGVHHFAREGLLKRIVGGHFVDLPAGGGVDDCQRSHAIFLLFSVCPSCRYIAARNSRSKSAPVQGRGLVWWQMSRVAMSTSRGRCASVTPCAIRPP